MAELDDGGAAVESLVGGAAVEPVGGAVVEAAPPAGGFTWVEPAAPGVPVVALLAPMPLVAPAEGVPVAPEVSLLIELLAAGALVAAALVLAPVEAIAEPAHQSRLARCRGEAAR